VTTTRMIAPDEAQMESTFNRDFSIQERLAYHRVQAVVEMAYERLGLVPQHLALGNEVQSLSRDGRSFCLGSKDAPQTLSCRTIGRGIPDVSQVEGVPLKVPRFGAVFDADGLGGSKGQPADNQTKVPWSTENDDMTRVARGDYASAHHVLSIRRDFRCTYESA
jgi:hypothetical protein